jgi:MFS superfamily sulfate permease-like transporter
MVGIKLIDYRGLVDIYHKAPREFIVALATTATVVFFGVEQGIILAVVLSLLEHVRRSYRPHAAVIVRDAEDHWRMEESVKSKMIEPGMVMFWFGSDLYYANVGFFAERTRKIVHDSSRPVRWLVIDCSAITGIDYSAARALRDLHQDLAKAGIVLALSRIQARHHGDLDQMGLIKVIGAHRIFESRHKCLEAYRTEVEAKPPPPKT